MNDTVHIDALANPHTNNIHKPITHVKPSSALTVNAIDLPSSSLLEHELAGFTHEDCFEVELPLSAFANQPLPMSKSISHDLPQAGIKPEDLLAILLTGFMTNSPKGVEWLMRIRNVLVSPIQLRTSSLGCPVSSLLSEDKTKVFAGTFPVLDEHVSDTRAQVLLGANDKHLQFRSCVDVQITPKNTVKISLSTRVRPKNWFGHFYMAVIYTVHTRYIEPTMLRYAVAYAL